MTDLEQNGSTTGSSKSPTDFLKSIKGKLVIVKLNSGVDYRGIAHVLGLVGYSQLHPSGVLACLDGYMNIAMEQTEVCTSLQRGDTHTCCVHTTVAHDRSM